MHSLLMSSLVGPMGKVIAFEPEKVSSGGITANVKLNNFRNIKLKKLFLERTVVEGNFLSLFFR